MPSNLPDEPQQPVTSAPIATVTWHLFMTNLWAQVKKEMSPVPCRVSQTAPQSVWQKICLLFDADLTDLASWSSPNDDVLQLAVKIVRMFSLGLATVLFGKVHYV